MTCIRGGNNSKPIFVEIRDFLAKNLEVKTEVLIKHNVVVDFELLSCIAL